MRRVTGDESLVVHALRHGISAAVCRAILAGVQDRDLNPLDEIAGQIRHSSAEVTLAWYFHQVEAPLRHWIDRAVALHLLPRETRCRLHGLNGATIRQRIRRSAMSDEETLSMAIANKTRSFPIASIAACVEFEERLPQPAPAPAFVLSLDNVLVVLTDLAADHGYSNTSLRNGVPLPLVRQIAMGAARALRLCEPQRTEAFRSWSGEPLDLLVSSSMTRAFGVDFRRARQPKYRSIIAVLNDPSRRAIAQRSWVSWWRCLDGGNISLVRPERARGVIALLAHAKVPVSSLAIRVQAKMREAHGDTLVGNPRGVATLALASTQAVCGEFVRAMGATPQIEQVALRRGRPAQYLLVAGDPLDGRDSMPSAAGSMTGFHALMIAAYALWTCRGIFLDAIDGQESQHE